MRHLTCTRTCSSMVRRGRWSRWTASPLAYRDPQHRTRLAHHVLLPPAGRLEAIVTGPRAGTEAKLRTLCFDTGLDGDPNPAMVLADLVDVQAAAGAERTTSADSQPPLFAVLSEKQLAEVAESAPAFTVIFTEDQHGF